LILTRIIEIVATRCQILRLKCAKFDFGCGSAPDPAKELTALPPLQTLLLHLSGLLLGERREAKGRKRTGGAERRGREGKALQVPPVLLISPFPDAGC